MLFRSYRSLSEDMSQTSRYVEPREQEDVFSFEFAKIIILSCTELESVFKAICSEISGSDCGNIGQYKETILSRFPNIINAEVEIPRYGQKIKPFAGWNTGHLFWWDAYNDVKHTRAGSIQQASYRNAVFALAALLIAILYYKEIINADFFTYDEGYLSTDYSDTTVVYSPQKKLPDYETANS